ncbi:MAG: hypothetical protein M1823_003826 [Watsoniomyces obsoletus]|nr:MAG: hypothetical protein M1823_003826 [Watsoniomyces obsoletus]
MSSEQEIERICTAPLKHYYEYLQVDPGAGVSEIRKARDKLHLKVHLDKNQNNEKARDASQRLNEAWGVLKNTAHRQDFDRQGAGSFKVPKLPDDMDHERNMGENAFGNEAEDEPEELQKDKNGHWKRKGPLKTETATHSLEKPDEAILRYYDNLTPAMQNLQKNPEEEATLKKLEKWDDTLKTGLKKQYGDDKGGRVFAAHQTRHLTFQAQYKLAATDSGVRNDIKELVQRHHYPSGWAWQLDTKDGAVQPSTKDTQGTPGENTGRKEGPGGGTGAKDKDKEDRLPGPPGPPGGAGGQPEDGIKTRDGHVILGYRKAGFGHRFLIKIETDEVTRYELRSGEKCGRSAADAYRASKGALVLGKVDDQYSRNDAKRWRELLAVASTKLNHMNYGRSRLPDTYVLVKFEGREEPVWLTRTTYRKIRGRTDADADIREWYTERDLVPAEDQDANAWVINNKVYLDMNLLEKVEDDGVEDENLNYRVQRSGIKRLPAPGRRLTDIDQIIQKAVAEREKAIGEQPNAQVQALEQLVKKQAEMMQDMLERLGLPVPQGFGPAQAS